MLYTIIWSNSDGHGGLVSWLGSTHSSEEAALEFAHSVAIKLWADMPGLTYMVFKHYFGWRECDE